MPIIYNLGSLNLDHVYQVPWFVRPGETLSSSQYEQFLGGKGFNQSVALARAGAKVHHIGAVGADGEALLNFLAKQGCVCDGLQIVDTPSGHAIIQVDSRGQNAIVLFAGANHKVTEPQVKQALAPADPEDWFLTQNETSCVGESLRIASSLGLTVAFNPAPMTDAVLDYPLDCVDVLFVNETEGQGLTGLSAAEAIADALRSNYPKMTVVCTLGAEGALSTGPQGVVRVEGRRVQVVDTTAAGDCFIGYYLASRIRGLSEQDSMNQACRAAALAVTRKGAAVSIPLLDEVAKLT